MNGAKVGTLVALLLLDLVWFEFVRHRLSGIGPFGAYEMVQSVFSGHAVRILLAVLKRPRRRLLEAAP